MAAPPVLAAAFAIPRTRLLLLLLHGDLQQKLLTGQRLENQ